jgi:hypothetical protein
MRVAFLADLILLGFITLRPIGVIFDEKYTLWLSSLFSVPFWGEAMPLELGC